jgi:hypothetical protein
MRTIELTITVGGVDGDGPVTVEGVDGARHVVMREERGGEPAARRLVERVLDRLEAYHDHQIEEARRMPAPGGN